MGKKGRFNMVSNTTDIKKKACDIWGCGLSTCKLWFVWPFLLSEMEQAHLSPSRLTVDGLRSRFLLCPCCLLCPLKVSAIAFLYSSLTAQILHSSACVNSLGLLSKYHTQSDLFIRNLLFRSPGSQWPELKVPAGPILSEAALVLSSDFFLWRVVV